MRAGILIAGGAVVVLAAVGGYVRFAQRPVVAVENPAPPATPVGITVQVLMDPHAQYSTFNPSGQYLASHGSGYADAEGRTLYTYDQDTETVKSACVGECAQTWPAAEAPADAQPVGDWSVVVHDDGSRQWAYKGKPLYRFAKDEGVGDTKGNGAGEGAWHTATFHPADGVKVPFGMAVQEIADISAQALVDARGMTLYAFAGDAREDRAACSADRCVSHWIPVSAPALANPIGDFTVAVRRDGTGQWAFKGRPLYSFDGDLLPGDANGDGLDTRWQPARVLNYFMPPSARIVQTADRGKVFATADGLTLYRQSAWLYQNTGHSLPHGAPVYPKMGRDIGTAGCDAECLKVWRPFAAPADAKPTGYWGVVTRDDNSKQWTYRGSAMYSFAGDKKVGDLNGKDVWMYKINESNNLQGADAVVRVSSVVDAENTAGLYWTYVYP